MYEISTEMFRMNCESKSSGKGFLTQRAESTEDTGTPTRKIKPFETQGKEAHGAQLDKERSRSSMTDSTSSPA